MPDFQPLPEQTMRVDIILGAGLRSTEVEELGILAERAGAATIWVQSFPGRRDPLLSIAGLARSTKRIRLGVMPTSPWEVHPLRIADGLLTLNELCDGRASIMIGGLGHSVMRVTGLQPTRRVTAVRDCVQILRGISPERMLNHEGEVFSLKNYQPEWATHRRPFISVGATGPAMLAMAAANADGLMMSDVPLVRMPEVMSHIDRGLSQAGRTRAGLRISNFMAWHIGSNRQAAMAEARRELVWRGLLQTWHTAGFLGEQDANFVATHRDNFLQAFLTRSTHIEGIPEHIIEQLVAKLTFAGGPEDIPRVAEEIAALAAAGLDEIALKVHDHPAEAIRLIGQHLIPALR